MDDDFSIIEALEILADCDEEGRYGPDVTEEFLRELVAQLADFAIIQHKLRALTQTQFEEAIDQRERRRKENETLEKENELLRHRIETAAAALGATALPERTSPQSRPTRTLTEAAAENFYEDDEPLVEVLHAFEQGEKGVTEKPYDPNAPRQEGQRNQYGDTWRNGRWETA